MAYTATSTSTYTPQTRDEYMQKQRSIIQPQYQQARNRLTEQYRAAQPTFQQGRNATDVYAAQNARMQKNLAANMGLYRSGHNMTSLAGIRNQAAGAKSQLDRDQALYAQQYANRLGELDQAMAGDIARAGMAYDTYGLEAERLRQALAGQQWQRDMYERGFDADEAYRKQQLELERWAQLQQLLAEQARQTDRWPDFGLMYGDYMKELLADWRG